MRKDIEKCFEERKILDAYVLRKGFQAESYDLLDTDLDSLWNYNHTINSILRLNRSNLFLPNSIFYFIDKKGSEKLRILKLNIKKYGFSH